MPTGTHLGRSVHESRCKSPSSAKRAECSDARRCAQVRARRGFLGVGPALARSTANPVVLAPNATPKQAPPSPRKRSLPVCDVHDGLRVLPVVGSGDRSGWSAPCRPAAWCRSATPVSVNAPPAGPDRGVPVRVRAHRAEPPTCHVPASGPIGDRESPDHPNYPSAEVFHLRERRRSDRCDSRSHGRRDLWDRWRKATLRAQGPRMALPLSRV